MNFRGVYIARLENVAIAHARALVQVDNAATHSSLVLSWGVTFNSTTSTSIEIAGSKRTTAGTKTSFTPIRVWGHPTALAGAGTNASSDSTAGDVVFREFGNYLVRNCEVFIPEERIILAPSERFAIYFVSAPSSVNVSAWIKWAEIA